jgi:PKD repeat protein
MAEEAPKSSIPGWLKAGVSSIFGLVGGAVLMYLTPLVNNAVKPPDPVANFGFQAQGLAVTFQNRAANATDGWWDFGDGSALEPFSPQQATVTHTYAKPGSYSVKLSLNNLFNEKADRTVTVNVDAGGAAPPTVETLDVQEVFPGVFKLTTRVKNADQLMWDSGDHRPFVFSTDTGGEQQHWITIKEPGKYTFRVVAQNTVSKQNAEKVSDPQIVAMPAIPGAPSATVTVTYEAVHVERKDTVIPVRLAWKDGCRDSVCPVSVEWPALQGYQVVKAELNGTGKDSRVRGVPDVKVAPDGSKVIVSAELNRPSLLTRFIPDHPVYVKVTQEKRSAPQKRMWALPMEVKVPGQTALPLPTLSSYWQPTSRQVTLDLAEGERKIWSGPDMPVNRPLQLQGHPVMVSATVQNNQLVLSVANPVSGPTPVGH